MVMKIQLNGLGENGRDEKVDGPKDRYGHFWELSMFTLFGPSTFNLTRNGIT